jgi:hypothetical protein
MPSQYGTSRLRTSRGIAAICVLLAYLLAGALHGILHHEIAVPTSDAMTMMSAATSDSHHADHTPAGDHHCHGCFSVAVPAPVLLATHAAPVTSHPLLAQAGIAGLTPSIDTPPPKHLT